MRARRYLEGIVGHCTDHVLKEDLRGEGVSVVDYGLPIGTVPAVHLHTPTATTQSPDRKSLIMIPALRCPGSQGIRHTLHPNL